MIAGKARHRVTLQKPQTATNDGWGEGHEYVDVLNVPAGIEPTRGRERMQADGVMAEVAYIVRIRNTPAIAELDETWRVKWTDRHQVTRTLDIVAAIDKQARGREWEIMASESRTREQA